MEASATVPGCSRCSADEACALIREAFTTSGDIIPAHRTQALAALCSHLTQARARCPGTNLVLRYETKPHFGPARSFSS